MCATNGSTIVQSTPNQVVCSANLSIFTAALIQTMITNQYATTPEAFVRYSVFEVGSDTHVQAYEWAESTMAFGQKRTMEITTHAQLDAVQAALIGIGGVMP